MVKPTPWGRGGGPRSEPPDTARAAAADTFAGSATDPGTSAPTPSQQRRERAALLLQHARARVERIRATPRLSGKWGYVFTAITGIVNFALLFQHWMVAKGPDGKAAATPFGRIDTTTRYLSVWSSQGTPHTANLTGVWAVTSSAVIAVTITAIAIYIVTDTPQFALVATGGSGVTALLTLAILWYLAARQKDLKTMTLRRWDLGGQIGSWINWAFNDGTKPVAGLNDVDYVATGTITNAALASVVIAVGGAVIALAVMPRSAVPRRLPWQISVSREKTPDDTVTDTEPADTPSADTATTRAEPPDPTPPQAAADGGEAESPIAPTSTDTRGDTGDGSN